MSVKRYTTQKGTRWMFTAHLGMDPYTGKRVLITRRGFSSKREAEEKLTEMKYNFDKNIIDGAASLTYRAVYEEWLPLYAQTVKGSTLNKTEGYFTQHILPVFGDDRLDLIKPYHCQEFANHLSRLFKVYRRPYSYAAKVFDYAIKTGKIRSANPFQQIIFPKNNTEVDPTPFLEVEELTELLQAMEGTPRWYTFFTLLAFTGLRRGEALALTWDDVDLIRGLLTVDKTLTVGPGNVPYVSDTKTKAGKRTIRLDPGTVSKLTHWKEICPPSERRLLFPTSKGGYASLTKPYTFLKDTLKKTSIKKPITIHSFRHTHCSLLFESGWTIKEVQDRLGHKDMKTTTDIYLHVTEKRKMKSMDSFINYISDKNF